MTTKRKTAKPGRKSTSKSKSSVSGLVSVLVNGQVSPQHSTFPASKRLADLVDVVGKAHGLRGVTIKIDGQKVEAPDLTIKLTGIKTVELVSKETRA